MRQLTTTEARYREMSLRQYWLVTLESRSLMGTRSTTLAASPPGIPYISLCGFTSVPTPRDECQFTMSYSEGGAD